MFEKAGRRGELRHRQARADERGEGCGGGRVGVEPDEVVAAIDRHERRVEPCQGRFASLRDAAMPHP